MMKDFEDREVGGSGILEAFIAIPVVVCGTYFMFYNIYTVLSGLF